MAVKHAYDFPCDCSCHDLVVPAGCGNCEHPNTPLDEVKAELCEQIKHSPMLCVCGGCRHEHHEKCHWKERDLKAKPMDLASVMPILHNKEMVILQFSGWAVVLRKDGTWFAEDTTGG